jgi:hypothetical protein
MAAELAEAVQQLQQEQQSLAEALQGRCALGCHGNLTISPHANVVSPETDRLA